MESMYGVKIAVSVTILLKEAMDLVFGAIFAATGVDFKDAIWPGSPATSSIECEIPTGCTHFMSQGEHLFAIPLPAEDEFPW